MAWTKRSYDALFRWPEGPAGQAVATRMMLADGLRDQVDRLIQAQNLGVWWQITGEAADVVGPAIVEASAKDAEKELDSAVGL